MLSFEYEQRVHTTVMTGVTNNATSMGIATVVVTHAPDQLDEDATYNIAGGHLEQLERAAR